MGQHSTTYDLQFQPIPPLSGPKLATLRWGGRGAPRPPSSHTITTTIDGGWFLTTGLHSTTYNLQFHSISPLSDPKLTLLRWGGRGAPPASPSRQLLSVAGSFRLWNCTLLPITSDSILCRRCRSKTGDFKVGWSRRTPTPPQAIQSQPLLMAGGF
jgi:hypothetical protein